ncbi:hypothetical protein LguiA_032459 [Lonicera macranthoides]
MPPYVPNVENEDKAQWLLSANWKFTAKYSNLCGINWIKGIAVTTGKKKLRRVCKDKRETDYCIWQELNQRIFVNRTHTLDRVTRTIEYLFSVATLSFSEADCFLCSCMVWKVGSVELAVVSYTSFVVSASLSFLPPSNLPLKDISYILDASEILSTMVLHAFRDRNRFNDDFLLDDDEFEDDTLEEYDNEDVIVDSDYDTGDENVEDDTVEEHDDE